MYTVCSWVSPIFHFGEIFILASKNMIAAFVKFLEHFEILPSKKWFKIEIWYKLKGKIELNPICFILRLGISMQNSSAFLAGTLVVGINQR